jgi:hypothetical protein
MGAFAARIQLLWFLFYDGDYTYSVTYKAGLPMA